MKGLQQENYRLRLYIIDLQSRILETSNEVPPPPVDLNLASPTTQQQQQPLDAQQEAPSTAQADPQNESSQFPAAEIQGPVQDEDSVQEKGEHPDRGHAPVADMSSSRPASYTLPPSTVEQLQAAAAEADGLDGISAPRVGE